MLKRKNHCKSCQDRIADSWIISTYVYELYVCPKCGEKYKWSQSAQRVNFAFVFVVLLLTIFFQRILEDLGWISHYGLLVDVLIWLGVMYTAMLLKIFIDLSEYFESASDISTGLESD